MVPGLDGAQLSGALGAAIAGVFLDRSWVIRRRASRGLLITAEGEDVLGRLAIDLLGLAR